MVFEKIHKKLCRIFPPKVMWLHSMMVLGIEKDGKKYLQISRIGKDGVLERHNFLVEHLVDDNLEITDQTLEEEKKFFTIVVPSSK